MTGYPSGEIEALAIRDWRRRVAPCPVSSWAIRAWCSALGIDLACFADERAPEGLIAPPPMLQCWAGSGLMATQGSSETMHGETRAAFLRAGFPAVVATDYEQEYGADLFPGDSVLEDVRIESISPAKQTSLGLGHFVTILFRFTKEEDVELGRLRVRTFYFDPARALPPRATAAPAGFEANVPDLILPLTPTLVIAGSIASNDFEAVHHDLAIARAQGLDNIILSIVTTSGLVWRHALQSVPGIRPAALKLRLGRPAFPGHTLHLQGRLTHGAALEIVGDTELGRHVTASMMLEAEHRSGSES